MFRGGESNLTGHQYVSLVGRGWGGPQLEASQRPSWDLKDETDQELSGGQRTNQKHRYKPPGTNSLFRERKHRSQNTGRHLPNKWVNYFLKNRERTKERYLGTSQEPQHVPLLKTALLSATVPIYKHLFQPIRENKLWFGISLKSVCANISIIQRVSIIVKSSAIVSQSMAVSVHENTPFVRHNVTSVGHTHTLIPSNQTTPGPKPLLNIECGLPPALQTIPISGWPSKQSTFLAFRVHSGPC